MATVVRAVGAGVLVVVLAGGAYLTADAYDVLPGGITLAPVPPGPSPFPTAPGLAAAGSPASPALADLDPQAPMPLAGTVQASVDRLVADPRLGVDTGVLVADRLTGEVLARSRPDEARTPASTIKLLTAAAALATLDPATTLPTRAVAGARDDEVVLVGGGDMMLAPGAGDPDAVVGHAGLADLASQVARELALRGTTTVRLLVDDTLFTGPTTSPGWTPGNLGQGYVAPVTALAVDIGRVSDRDLVPRATDPSITAARRLVELLAEQGITVDGSPKRGIAPADARQLGEVRSAPLEQVVGYALTTSDNTIAEVIGRLVAIGQGLPASFSGATQAVLHVVDTLGVDTAGAHITDCSGLAAGSAISPRTLVAVLSLVFDESHPRLRPVAATMPIAALTGTLSDRFGDGGARGEVRAKTGSLTGVTTLAGMVLTQDGRQLVFAVMADATPAGGQAAPRKAIDQLVTDLAGCGCR